MPEFRHVQSVSLGSHMEVGVFGCLAAAGLFTAACLAWKGLGMVMEKERKR